MATASSAARHVQTREQPPPWMAPWNELVIYELHVGTFNGAANGRPGGFEAAVEKLPYLRDLGINAIEIMPVAEFAGRLLLGLQPRPPLRRDPGLRRAGRLPAPGRAAHDPASP